MFPRMKQISCHGH